MRVAVLQNYVGIDGRTRVLAEVASILNERGIVPEVHCLGRPATAEKVSATFGVPARFTTRVHTAPDFRRGNLYKCLLLNKLAAHDLEDYDLILNSNNCLQFLPTKPAWIHYIHFPLAGNFEFKMEYGKSPAARLYAAPAMAILKLVPAALGHRALVLGNSEFTSDVIARAENLPRESVGVLYPPVSAPEGAPRMDREDLVVSIGTFSPPKRQLEQIEFAARFPEVRFVLIGNASYDPKYVRECEAAAGSLPNVRILGNAKWSEIEDHLGRARWFVHSTRHEPFGISPVEAMLRGCIPLVHDSGGVRETVPFSELRWTDGEDLAAKFEAVRLRDEVELRGRLLAHARRFTPEFFRPAFGAALDRVLAIEPAGVA
ncbi:MAG: glycosyltransferase family 4 protein [Gemmatimonadetes bacterium]|nr:glycosyltransferase family 4 protein [Gemmatimonadota bacterium]